MGKKQYCNLKETKISSDKIHRGVVGFNKDTVKLIDGRTATREYMVHPGASGVLPIIGDKVVLVQQYRYPISRATWEIPAGKAQEGKTPLGTAKAELKEETGYTAGKIKKLISFHPCCAFSDEELHIFIAYDLKPGKTNPDADEFLNVKIFPLKTAYAMIKKGLIKDAKTVIALTLYKDIAK